MQRMKWTFWLDKWATQQIGFHQDEINPMLIAHHHRLTGGKPCRVLVPLCGKSLDMTWLADQGHEVIGIEFVPEAVEQFFRSLELTPYRRQQLGEDVSEAGKYTLFRADFFDVLPETTGEIHAIYDRAAIVAIDPERRAEYAERLCDYEPDAILLHTVTYDQAKVQGPPWSIPPQELRGLFPGWKCEIVYDEQRPTKNGRFQDAGLDSLQATWWVITPAD
jgi:thiopurine S-methyltransferase